MDKDEDYILIRSLKVELYCVPLLYRHPHLSPSNKFLPRYIATLAYHQIQLDPKGG